MDQVAVWKIFLKALQKFSDMIARLTYFAIQNDGLTAEQLLLDQHCNDDLKIP